MSKSEALRQARDLADTSWLPMTVCRAGHQWQVIESTSPALRRACAVVTVLPRGYFSGYWLI